MASEPESSSARTVTLSSYSLEKVVWAFASKTERPENAASAATLEVTGLFGVASLVVVVGFGCDVPSVVSVGVEGPAMCSKVWCFSWHRRHRTPDGQFATACFNLRQLKHASCFLAKSLR